MTQETPDLREVFGVYEDINPDIEYLDLWIRRLRSGQHRPLAGRELRRQIDYLRRLRAFLLESEPRDGNPEEDASPRPRLEEPPPLPRRPVRSSTDAARDLAARLRLGDPVSEGPLTLIPLFDPEAPDRPDVDLLEEALRRETFVVEETGTVGELRMHNRGDRPVLLLDGDEVVGGSQNRVLNTAVLVAAGARLAVPVSCVERGRWDMRRRTDRFRSSPHVAPTRLRHSTRQSVSRAYHLQSSPIADQGEVWDSVDDYDSGYCTDSPSSALHDTYHLIRHHLDRFFQAFHPLEGQVGLAACLGREAVALDVVAHPSLYLPLHERLLGSMAMDAMMLEERGFRDPRGFVSHLLRRLAEAPLRSFRSVGLGRDVRLPDDPVSFQALVWERVPLCASAFEESHR